MNNKQVKMPPPPKRFERQFAEFAVFMVEQLAKRFKNQTLLSLNQGTVEKFSDSLDEMPEEYLAFFDAGQVGNYSRVYLTMANRVRRKLVRQFNNGRMDLQTREILGRANKYNQEQVYKSASPAIGIDTASLIAKEGLKPQVNALMLETSQWAKKLRDDTLEHFTANTLRGMANGESLETIIEGFDAEALKVKSKAKFIARNQIANFNGITTKIRHQKLGITQGVWITSRDERVRRCHDVRDGKTFELSEGLYSSCDGKALLPGQDYQCRCIYQAVIPEIEQ